MTFPKLQYFKESEFRHPERMDPEFLYWLNTVREWAGVPFIVTSDARSMSHNAKIGGSPNSLHIFNEYDSDDKVAAIDFTTPKGRARNLQGWQEDLWEINRSIATSNLGDVAIQLELVQGPTDWHIHVAWYPPGDPRKSKIILKLD